jgi:hypothetical protein
MEEHEDDNIIKTCDGKHIFCKTCFEDWKQECFKENDIVICPLCRSELPEYKKNGIFIEYYENGQMKYFCKYINNYVEDVSISYYKDGMLKEIYYNINGVKRILDVSSL